jgi:hypothetical protein
MGDLLTSTSLVHDRKDCHFILRVSQGGGNLRCLSLTGMGVAFQQTFIRINIIFLSLLGLQLPLWARWINLI